ncbi:hypothetical protein OE88DRAFT_1203568 [Heliocybe sulcata]|uniref:DUF7727 domain-containing protein n=1 Tax=Heliocybe sulcata TaxID=5364 RepID=A0A5C3NEP2_9AGAM|nr:hypothetical protein OE88DRAFT_1203568 [Heliocybe sulcata]
MGNLIWHEYARLLTITSSVYTIWAAFWGIFFRKFFWDFVGGIVRAPGGLQPSKSNAVFITLIVKAPIIQLFAMLLAFAILAMEVPLPQLKGSSFHRNFVVRIPMLLLQAFLTILFYQGTNASLWSMISAACYARAVVLGEVMKEAKDNRGKGGRA